MAIITVLPFAFALTTCRHQRTYTPHTVENTAVAQVFTSNASSSPCSSGPQCRRQVARVSSSSTNGFVVARRFGLAMQCRVRKRGGQAGRCALADGNGSSVGDGPSSAERAILKSRRDMLQEYVKSVQPEFMEKFVKRAPEQVVEAMRQTVTNMMGTLPPQFFEISVSTVAENLAQLMYSVMMTGYMFRNAQFRLELQQSLSQVALRDPTAEDSPYEQNVNKTKVSGEVLRWHKEDGIEQMPAVEYIEMLESEICELQQQIESNCRVSRGRNELLEYLKSLQPHNLQELTTTAGEDALEAMNTFITRLLGVKEPAQLKRAATETSASELAKLLYWLMVVGYSIRNIEVRYDMERILGMPVSSQKLAKLPPGEMI